MKLPIPSDWDGQAWQCIEVQWPKSQSYNALLLGLLSLMTRGRLWDEDTGTITDMQAIAWQVFNANYPLVPCATTEPPEPPEPPETLGNETSATYSATGIESALGDEDMGQVVTDVQVVNGRLRVFFGPCCYHDISGSQIAEEPGDSVDPEQYEEILPEGGSYSACGKAKAIHEAVIAVAESAWDERLNPLVWQWPGHVESDAGIGDLKDTWIVNAVLEALKIDIVFGQGDLFDATNLQQALCQMSNLLPSVGGGITADEFSGIKNIYIATFGLALGNFWGNVVNAIGHSRMGTIAAAGAVTQNADCNCPDPDYFDPAATDPDANGWFLGPDISSEVLYHVDAGNQNKVAYWTGTNVHDVYGVWMRFAIRPGSDNLKRMSQTNILAGHPGLFTPQTVNVTIDTSDALQNINQLYPHAQGSSQPIVDVLSQQRGYTTAVRGTSGVDNLVVASPEWLATQSGAWCITTTDETAPDWMLELRWVYNVNSPSHA